MVSIFAEMQANATNVLRIKSVDPRKFCRKSKVWAFDFSLLVLIAQGSVEHELVAPRAGRRLNYCIHSSCCQEQRSDTGYEGSGFHW